MDRVEVMKAELTAKSWVRDLTSDETMESISELIDAKIALADADGAKLRDTYKAERDLASKGLLESSRQFVELKAKLATIEAAARKAISSLPLMPNDFDGSAVNDLQRLTAEAEGGG